MKRTQGTSIAVFVVALLAMLWPARANANIGLPVGAAFWPATWVLFLPVVLVEAFVARRDLRLDFRRSFALSLKANAWSTAAGVPVACLLMLFVGLMLGSGPGRARWPHWFADLLVGSAVWTEGVPDWALFGGPALICIPSYFLSVSIESWSARKSVTREEARHWARKANLITYGFLLLALGIAATITGMGAAPNRSLQADDHLGRFAPSVARR